MKNNEVAIIIPIYQEQISDYEKISFLQCFRILGQYPIYLVAPENLNIQEYNKLAASNSFKVIRFNNKFFQGIAGYNKLMMSVNFYETFSSFRYILIHQLDAFVFRDELLHWCHQNYDYIGAPWIEVGWRSAIFWYIAENHNSIYRKCLYKLNPARSYEIGNGGFSLRKVSAHLRALKWFDKTAKNWAQHEDCFYTHIFTDYYPFFSLPNKKTAALFSFEKAVETFPLTNKIPFGCHAWFKGSYSFWKPEIEKFGYKLP